MKIACIRKKVIIQHTKKNSKNLWQQITASRGGVYISDQESKRKRERVNEFKTLRGNGEESPVNSNKIGSASDAITEKK